MAHSRIVAHNDQSIRVERRALQIACQSNYTDRQQLNPVTVRSKLCHLWYFLKAEIIKELKTRTALAFFINLVAITIVFWLI